MKTYPPPTQNEYKDFLIRVYFGTGPEYLRLCIRRAYLDFYRTLHGISFIPGIYQHASSEIEKSIVHLKNDSSIAGQESFDDWHHAACNHLCTIYSDHGYKAFYVGQAQKWLNMSFKYIFESTEKSSRLCREAGAGCKTMKNICAFSIGFATLSRTLFPWLWNFTCG